MPRGYKPDCRETTLLVSIEPIFLRPDPDRVLSVVAALTGVPLPTWLSPARTRPVSHARKLAMYLLRTEAGLSHAKVARLIGRGTATVITLTRDVAEDVRGGTRSVIERARAILREGESGAERGAHLQCLQARHGGTAERATQFLQTFEAARGAAH